MYGYFISSRHPLLCPATPADAQAFVSTDDCSQASSWCPIRTCISRPLRRRVSAVAFLFGGVELMAVSTSVASTRQQRCPVATHIAHHYYNFTLPCRISLWSANEVCMWAPKCSKFCQICDVMHRSSLNLAENITRWAQSCVPNFPLIDEGMSVRHPQISEFVDILPVLQQLSVPYNF